MTSVRLRPSSHLVVLCALAIALPPDVIAQTPAAPAPATAPARPATTPAEPDLGWPRSYPAGGGTAVMYAPQVATWDNQKHIVAWSAVRYDAVGAKQPAMGVIKIESDTSVSTDERLVSFKDFSITESNFASLTRDQTRTLIAALQQGIPEGERILALDRVLAAVDKSAIRPRNVDNVKADPPKIYASTKPALLVNLDGKPVWSPIKGVDLQFAVNTNWDLFEQPSTKTAYLRNETTWLKAPDLNGPWTPAGTLPAAFKQLPADDNWNEVRANLPGKSISANAVPSVFVASEPAELLLLTGAPAYKAVTGTNLLWVSNTESDLFRLGKAGSFFYLVAGRWFSAPAIEGPWTFATPTLPADFKRIPVDHDRSRVLASVPGTEQANEAVLLAQIPQTARVNRKELKAPDVAYQGDPQFQAIEGTSLSRAVNTDKDIIKVGDLYYMCFQAVWFRSRSAEGPWEVANTVPAEVYDIPPSSPVHNVTYVTVQESDPNDDWVTFAYVAGYTGMMVAWGCAVWGTGWYYPPYVWYGGMYPAYYGYGRTYGMSAWYNPWTGAYGRATGVYGPFGGVTAAARYNPRTGTYSRGAAAYGPYGGRAVAQAYNPRTGTYAQTRQGSNVYGNWGSTSVQRGDNWAQAGHVTNNRTGTTTGAARTSEGGGAVTRSGADGRSTVARTGDGDVYAGHDGSVYRKQADGSWQQWNDGGWSNAEKPAQRPGEGGSGTRPGGGDAATRPAERPTDQLNRDWNARTKGADRTSGYGSFRSSPTPARAGSFRGGGRGRGR